MVISNRLTQLTILLIERCTSMQESKKQRSWWWEMPAHTLKRSLWCQALIKPLDSSSWLKVLSMRLRITTRYSVRLPASVKTASKLLIIFGYQLSSSSNQTLKSVPLMVSSLTRQTPNHMSQVSTKLAISNYSRYQLAMERQWLHLTILSMSKIS